MCQQKAAVLCWKRSTRNTVDGLLCLIIPISTPRLPPRMQHVQDSHSPHAQVTACMYGTQQAIQQNSFPYTPACNTLVAAIVQ